ncbi:type IV secretion system protein VirB10 [Achromobacter mucicolens]|uniref:type IV secretion system protein VirB10 n=1 Tax=Achromobacter mucicolens TaxID=1389922 RepID=UPI002449C5D7|nr:type IV secretion system protein VirB10 [Achromobacter mucicolens]MDH0090877.1 type IV secretion system protein VirB10 [Achromobacter mucicolens]
MRFFKRKRRASAPVDAVAEIERQQAQIEARGRPDLQGAAKPRAPGAKAFFMLLLLMAVMILGTIFWRWINAIDKPDEHALSDIPARIENIMPGLKLRSEPKPEPAPPPPPPAESAAATTALPATGTGLSDIAKSIVVDPVMQRRLSSGLQAKKDGEQSQTTTTAPAATPVREADSGPMADRLKPMKLNAALAGTVGNRDMLVTQGTMIDCLQDTKFVSAQAGMITCYAPRDVRSTSGRVVLIDAGTKFIGYQQGVLAQGQPRIGVVWSRLETPKGVIIHLDSPGTGPLGEAGLDGHIDTHFAERFGGAILVSLISDFGAWASSRGGSGSENGSIRFDSTGDAAQDAVSTVLDNSINIPPTLYRNQGGRVGIYVARDLDFSSVYDLRPIAR